MPTIFRLLLLIFTISFLQGCFAEKYLREIPGLGKDPEPMVADEDSSEPASQPPKATDLHMLCTCTIFDNLSVQAIQRLGDAVPVLLDCC